MGIAIIGGVFVAVFLTVFGAVIGTVISLAITHSLSSSSVFASPHDFLYFMYYSGHATGTYIGGGVGAVLGLLAMLAMIRRAADINWLKRYGTRIVATVTEIERHMRTSTTTTGSGPYTRTERRIYYEYIIVARWVDPSTQLMYTFRSHTLYSPGRFYPGCGIGVLVDLNDLNRYYVEV